MLYNAASVNRYRCLGGEIGRRKGLKIPRGKPRAGSTPARGTIYKSTTYVRYAQRFALRFSVRAHYRVHSIIHIIFCTCIAPLRIVSPAAHTSGCRATARYHLIASFATVEYVQIPLFGAKIPSKNHYYGQKPYRKLANLLFLVD